MKTFWNTFVIVDVLQVVVLIVYSRESSEDCCENVLESY